MKVLSASLFTRRAEPCAGCPFRPDREGPPLDRDTRATVARRIREGEQWVCHQTCDGARVTASSQLCALAPGPGR